MKAKISAYKISPLIQKIFIGIGVAAYLAQLVSILPMYLTVYGGAFQYSQFTLLVAEMTLMPLLLFAIAYFAGPRRGSLLGRIWVALFFTVIGLMIQAIVQQLMQVAIEVVSQAGVQFDVTLWYQVVPPWIVLLGFVAVIMRHRAKEAEKVDVPLQRAFVALAFTMLAVIIGMTLYRILSQFASNQNLSGFLVSSIQGILLPAVMFTGAYLIGGAKRAVFTKVFEAVLMTAIGLMAFGIVYEIGRYCAPYFIGLSGQFEVWALYECIVAVIGLALFGGLLVYLRKQRAIA